MKGCEYKMTRGPRAGRLCDRTPAIFVHVEGNDGAELRCKEHDPTRSSEYIVLCPHCSAFMSCG